MRLEDEAGTSACEGLWDHCPSRLKLPISNGDGERAATFTEAGVKDVALDRVSRLEEAHLPQSATQVEEAAMVWNDMNWSYCQCVS